MLSRANALNWGFNEKLTSAQINAIDSQLPYAIDGNAGGLYAPSSVISIGGSGIQITGPAEFQGNVVIDNLGSTNSLSVGGNIGVGGVFNSTGSANFSGTATQFAEGWESATGKTCTVLGDMGVGTDNGNELTVWAHAYLNGDATFIAGKTVTFNEAFAVAIGKVSDWGGGYTQVSSTGIYVSGTGTAQIDGTSSFGDAMTIASTAPVSLASAITPTGDGHIKKRIFIGSDANITVGVAGVANVGDDVVVPAFSASRTWTLTSTGAAEGDEVEFTARALTGAFTLTIQNDSAVPLVVLQNSTSGDRSSARFIFTSGAWLLFSYTVYA